MRFKRFYGKAGSAMEKMPFFLKKRLSMAEKYGILRDVWMYHTMRNGLAPRKKGLTLSEKTA